MSIPSNARTQDAENRAARALVRANEFAVKNDMSQAYRHYARWLYWSAQSRGETTDT